jgi:hypothetical protein
MSTTTRREPEYPPLCPKCGNHRTRIVGRSGNPPGVYHRCESCEYVFSVIEFRQTAPANHVAVDPVRALLPVLDSTLNDLMFSLYRTRQALADIQQRMGTDPMLVGQIGQALASARESERVLANIQQRLDSVRR